MAEKKRSYLKQSDVPRTSLDEALRVPKAILDQYAGAATTPFNVAKALGLDPKGSQMKVITGSAIAFGLTEGGAQSSSISITDLAKTILRPLDEGADLEARKEALLKPRIFGEFLRKYDTHTFPRDDIARNVLIEMGVPDDQAEDVRARIEESALSMGFIEEIKGKKYIHLNSIASGAAIVKANVPNGEEVEDDSEEVVDTENNSPEVIHTSKNADDGRSRRVFITHGKNKDFIEPIKKLLGFGEMISVVSVEKQSVSKPVPDKVMDDMRSCGAAIIHVDAERTLIDKEANEFNLVNENVLIEIGAAMALYGRRFILLVKNGVKLPSNLQGLYEVRYTDDKLDGDATIRLLEAINDIKNNPSPDRYN
ncbi:nucleotide-binding protein [Shewanella sp. N2AIL]|uniref:TIR domain-containing protein n=1 Tax=Shewanella sp. N2AIL TaxID=2926851 RepID=UPI001F565A10|nr:TIR domain-containing protein [Shewanella sp. N2AIL]MCI2962916.1 nucleotide-binding protein [Shewanella sp. N2AIL]